jgi:hypothetical protein
MPGVFAAGDVRLGSLQRVASAVGEGALVVQQVHEFLDQEGDGVMDPRASRTGVPAREGAHPQPAAPPGG